jgi:hypothetical protein
MKGKETAVQLPAGPFQHAYGNLYACFPQLFNAFAAYFSKGISTAYYHVGNAFFHDPVGTGRRFTVMGAGLQRYVHGGLRHQVFVGFRYTFNTIYLCMGMPVLPVIALADNAALVHQHSAHHGIGRYLPGAHPGQLKAALHKKFVLHSVHALNVGYVCKSIIFRSFA